jgi:adiponectin receptor
MFINEGLIEPYTNYIIGGITMGGLYIFGASLYVLRVPERFCPGVFDVWAHSHQLFHICVVAAALVHYDTLLSMIKDRLELGDCITAPTMVAGGFV